MSSPTINFSNLRLHNGSQHTALEELTRQIVIAENYPDIKKIEHRGQGADGGVEIEVKFEGGYSWGWQSKWFPKDFSTSEVSQLKKSFKSALKSIPSLSKFYVAIPMNLSSTGEGRRQSQQKFWDKFVAWAKSEALKESRNVDIELWDESFFISRLQKNNPTHTGIRNYWFDSQLLTADVIQQKLDKALAQIQDRYSPEFHVELHIAEYFHLLSRNSSFISVANKIGESLSKCIKECRYFLKDEDGKVKSLSESIYAKIQNVSKIYKSLDFNDSYVSVSELLDSFDKLTFCDELDELYEIAWKNKEKTEEESDKSNSEHSTYEKNEYFRVTYRNLKNEIDTASNLLGSKSYHLLTKPYLLVLGDAGSGKSHLLADEINNHISDQEIGFFIPGQNISSPLKVETDILTFLDVQNMSFGDWLGTVSSSAMATGKPAIIAIDAINESENAQKWVEALPSLLVQIQRFPNIALVISCRTDYRMLCLPNDISTFTQVNHYGFAENVGKAAKKYLDKHGIARPSVPIFGLENQFANPLFLSTCVKALKNNGITVFPGDLDSLPNLLEYWIESVENNLIRKGYERIDKSDGKLIKAIQVIANEMAINLKDYIPFDDAKRICEKVVDLGKPAKQTDLLINKLISEGVLIDRINFDDQSREVAFTFQKFSDYFIAEAIVYLIDTPKQLASALSKDGDLSQIFHSEKFYQNHQYAGIRKALLSLIPMKFGLEPLSLVDDFWKTTQIDIKEYVESIPWRKSFITEDTKSILVQNLVEVDTASERKPDYKLWFDLLVELAMTENCTLNADYLFECLSKQDMADRDLTWSKYLVGQIYNDEDGEFSNVQQLIDWAWVAPKSELNLERVKLASKCLGLFLTTMDRVVRDQATKALTSLLIKFPQAIPDTLEAFINFNDAYVRERVYAAVYGSLSYVNDEAIIHKTGQVVFDEVFDVITVEQHSIARRYAQLIINLAVRNGLQLSKSELDKTKPPYKTDKINNWPTLDEIRLLQDDMSSIVYSVVGHLSDKPKRNELIMEGDFGKYIMSTSSFLHGSLDGGLPLNIKQQKERFWQNAKKHISDKFDVQAFELAFNNRPSQSYFRLLNNLKSESNSAQSIAEEDFKALEKEFLVLLSQELVDIYNSEVLWGRNNDDKFEKFPKIKAKCWVVQRVKELGWKNDAHGKLEKSMRYFGGRRDHQNERIGKKYQWIAYNELIAYLQDHHWYQDWEEEPHILDRVEDFFGFDIDTTFLASENYIAVKQNTGFLPEVSINNYKTGTAKQNCAWAKTIDNIPDIPQMISKNNWYIINSDAEYKIHDDDSNDEQFTKTMRFHLDMLIIPKGRELELLGDLKDTSKSDHNETYFHEGEDNYLYAEFSQIAGEKKFSDLFDHKIHGIPVMSPTMYYYNSRQYDYSGTSDYSSFKLPRWPLLRGMQLKPVNSYAKSFMNNDEATVFISNEKGFYGGSTVIKSNELEAYLKEYNLCCVWRSVIEKDGGFGSYMGRGGIIKRGTFIGLHWISDKKWQGELFLRDVT